MTSCDVSNLGFLGFRILTIKNPYRITLDRIGDLLSQEGVKGVNLDSIPNIKRYSAVKIKQSSQCIKTDI